METQSMLEKLPTLTSGEELLVKDKDSAFKELNLKNLDLRTQLLNVLLVNLNVDVTVSP
jgi:hypothetical protein